MLAKQRSKYSFFKRLVKALKSNYQLRLTSLFLLIGFGIGCVYAYYAIDAYYHTFRNYVAYQDNFKVHFPGKPVVYNLTSTDSLAGVVVSSRDYKYVSAGASYQVIATKYANINTKVLSMASLKSLLDASVNQAAKTLNLEVNQSKTIKFNGLIAQQAILSSSNNYIVPYVLTFIKKQTIYKLEVKVSSLIQYTNFIDSFHFLSNQ